MRQVFSSPRLENVERVATLLREAGIETRITHGRSYRGGLRGNFSYRDHVRTEPVPAVWVVKSADQPTAREILRSAGLLDSTRGETGYTLPLFRTEEAAAIDSPARKRAFRLKVGLLLVIAVVITLAFVSQCSPRRAATTSTPTTQATPPGMAPIPDSLALAILAGELPARAGQAVCLSIDGADPSNALLAALPPSPGQVLPASQCATRPDLQTLAIGSYRRSGAGGSITLERRRGATLSASHTYDVRPEGTGWRVIAPYR